MRVMTTEKFVFYSFETGRYILSSRQIYSYETYVIYIALVMWKLFKMMMLYFLINICNQTFTILEKYTDY